MKQWQKMKKISLIVFLIFTHNLLYANNHQVQLKQAEKYLVKEHKFDKAIEIFTKICESKQAKKAQKINACEKLLTIYDGKAEVYIGGNQLHKYRAARELQDIDKKVKYATMACDLDSVYGCVALGNFYKNGDGVEKDLKKTTKLYTKACELQVSLCTNLGVFYEYDLKDIESALKAYKKVCEQDKKWDSRCVNYDRLRKEIE